jgi:hypothetical protein
MDNGTVAVASIKKFVDIYAHHPTKTSIKIFNNLISEKKEISSTWMMNVEDSWLAPRINAPSKT